MNLDFIEDCKVKKIYVVGKDNKYGYMDNHLAILVPCIYDMAYPVIPLEIRHWESYTQHWYPHAIVKKENKFGVLSVPDNTEMLPCEFDSINHPYYSKYNLGQEFWHRSEISNSSPPYLVFASKDDKWGIYFIHNDKPYEQLIPHEYKYIWGPFLNNPYVYAKKFNNKFVVLDPVSKKEIEAVGEVDQIDFGVNYNSYCTICIDNKWGVFSFIKGTITHECKYKKINPYPFPGNTKAALLHTFDGNVGVANLHEKDSFFVPPKYNNVCYENGSFIVFNFGKKGIVADSKEIIPCEYFYIENVLKSNSNRYFIVQKFKNSKFGILDLQNKFTTELKYDKLQVLNMTVNDPKSQYILRNELKYPIIAGLILGLKENTWEQITLE